MTGPRVIRPGVHRPTPCTWHTGTRDSTAEADFSLGHVGVATGQPGPENIGSAHHVRMRSMVTSSAAEDCLAYPVLRCHVPAFGTRAGGVAGVHCDQLTTSLFRFAGKHAQEHPPARVEDGAIEAGLDRCAVRQVSAEIVGPGSWGPGHILDPECLVNDEVIAANQRQSGLVSVVETLAAHTTLDGRNAFPGSLSSGGATLAPHHQALSSCQPSCGRRAIAWVRDMHSVRGGQERRDAEVHSGNCSGRREGMDRQIVAGQQGVPAAPLPLDDHLLDPSSIRDRSVLVAANGAYAGDIQPSTTQRSIGRRLRNDERVPSTRRLKAGVAGFPASLRSSVEGSKGLLQPPQWLSGRLHVQRPDIGAQGSQLGELNTLLEVGDGLAASRPGPTSVFQASVINLAVNAKRRVQRDDLFRGRPQQEPIRATHTSILAMRGGEMLVDTPTPCECLCVFWAHQDCTGEGDTPVTVVRSGHGRTIRVCGPCADDLAQRVPGSARRAA